MQDGSERDINSGAVAGGRGRSIRSTGPFHATQHISRPHPSRLTTATTVTTISNPCPFPRLRRLLTR